MNKPHVHAELIKQWADGAEIQYFHSSMAQWLNFNSDEVIQWLPHMEYRIKPEPPKYPLSKMTGADLYEAWFSVDVIGSSSGENMAAIANAAIARAIQDGDVVPASWMEKAAKEVHKQAQLATLKTNLPEIADEMLRIDIFGIINHIKEGN